MKFQIFINVHFSPPLSNIQLLARHVSVFPPRGFCQGEHHGERQGPSHQSGGTSGPSRVQQRD